jgi:hypothetical protein
MDASAFIEANLFSFFFTVFGRSTATFNLEDVASWN